MGTKDFEGRLVLVTGGGSGIGRETAIAFAKAGASLVLVDRSEAGLVGTAATIESLGRRAATYVVDVTDAEAMRTLAADVERAHGVVDVLVNNAGIGSAGRFLDTTLETWRKVLDVNVMGVVHGCHAFLPAMVARGRGGHVVNLASLAAYLASPDMPIYATSKFAVLGFSESLRADMARHGIGVTAICPGLIDTPIVRTTIMEGEMARSGVRERIQSIYARRAYTPARVAEAILDGVRRNDAVRPVSPESWVAYFAKRAAPTLLARLSQLELPGSR